MGCENGETRKRLFFGLRPGPKRNGPAARPRPSARQSELEVAAKKLRESAAKTLESLARNFVRGDAFGRPRSSRDLIRRGCRAAFVSL